MTPAGLARASGVSEPKLSRWIKGTQMYISDDDLESLAIHITADPKQRAELVVARLKDNLSGSGSEFVQISIAGAPLRDHSKGLKSLPVALQEAIPLFAENWKDPDVRNMILGLASLLRAGTAQINSAGESDNPGKAQSTDTAHLVKRAVAIIKTPKRKESK